MLNSVEKDWNRKVKKVCVILTSSRSGSSVFKSVLAQHPQIATLDGELEPFFVLTKNGFPFTSNSDSISSLQNIESVVDLIKEYIRIPSENLCEPKEIKIRWLGRLNLQFPDSYFESLLDSVISKIAEKNITEERDIHSFILGTLFKDESWKKSYYDTFFDKGNMRPFDQLKIEEPPFVLPSLHSRRIVQSDLEDKTFLFKTPQDAYRIGIYEQLFPSAEIKYIHLTRGFAQTVNGLMDGWLSPVGFFAHDLSREGVKLDINGYSNKVDFGRKWWKFDLPLNWKDFVRADLIDVCLNQWLSAHTSILSHAIKPLQIRFEDFISEPEITVKTVTDYLSVARIDVNIIPVIMATETPGSRRWIKREKEIMMISKKLEVRKMMQKLGYNLDPQTWL